jgi:hypothetical protein
MAWLCSYRPFTSYRSSVEIVSVGCFLEVVIWTASPQFVMVPQYHRLPSIEIIDGLGFIHREDEFRYLFLADTDS